jgi:hypothetical protein
MHKEGIMFAAVCIATVWCGCASAPGITDDGHRVVTALSGTLDTAFAGTGAVVAEAAPLPPPPPKELSAWIQPDIRFETAWFNYVIPGVSVSPHAFIVDITILVFNWYMGGQIGIPFNKNENGVSAHISLVGYLLRYNDYFYIPVDIGYSVGEDDGGSFMFSTGIMKLWEISRWDALKKWRIYTAVKLNLGTNASNYLTNTLMLSAGIFHDPFNRRIRAREEP